MFREGSRSGPDLELRVEEFIASLRPAGGASAYELLFIPSDGETPFAPPPEQLTRCLRAWADLVEQIVEPPLLDEANWVEAAEITFAYLVCAGRAGLNLDEGELLQRIVTSTRAVETRLRGALEGGEAGEQALERISAVAQEIVLQGYAAEPPV